MATTRMNRKQFETAVRDEINRLWQERKAAVLEMAPNKENPQVAKMITKNEGYLLALEDVVEFILKQR